MKARLTERPSWVGHGERDALGFILGPTYSADKRPVKQRRTVRAGRRDPEETRGAGRRPVEQTATQTAA